MHARHRYEATRRGLAGCSASHDPWRQHVAVNVLGRRRRRPSAMSFDDLLPEIGEDLLDYQEEAGAVFGEGSRVPLSYGNNSRALFSIEEDAVVIDASEWSRIRVSGPDAEAFLHGQLSADIKRLSPGDGCEACLLTPQGRVIDLLLVLRMETGFIIVCSPGMGGEVKDHLEKHVFMSDNVQIMDVSGSTSMLRLVGPKSNDIMYTMQLKDGTLGGQFGAHEVVGFDGKPLVVVKGSDLGYSGYSLIIDESAAGTLWKTLVSGFGATPMGSEAWNIARVMSGRPSQDELREPVTAFETGLYHAVSLNKGCYVGQEALAKIYGHNANKQEIWGLRVEKPCAAGDGVFVSDANGDSIKVGKVTSYVDDVSKTPAKHLALAFLKKSRKQGALPSTWNNATVSVGASDRVRATVTSLPYVSRKLRPEDEPPVAGTKEATRKDDLDAKQAKLLENQRRMESFLRQQQGS
jgi:folate-binding protein YgfZ